MCTDYSPEGRLIYAVMNSPDSRKPVRAPSNRRDARRLKTANTFFCSTTLGGCGEELTFAIGEINVPHFRHRAGSQCSLMVSDSLADRYTHLAIQEALRVWIEAMPGFTCQLEVSIESGRTDVLATSSQFEVALEVQRSQLSAHKALERTTNYAHRANAVHWLYAYRDIDAYKAELADRGWSLRIWWGWAKRECRIGVSYEGGSGTELEFNEIGGPLTDWELSASGLESAHLRQAKQAVERWREVERRRQFEEAAALAEQEAAERERAAADREKAAAARRQEAVRREAERVALLERMGQIPPSLENGWPSSWPDLLGSAKQVHWAETIRAQLVGQLREELVMEWLAPERGLPVAHWLALETSAASWINKRKLEVIDLLHMHERQFGPPGERKPKAS